VLWRMTLAKSTDVQIEGSYFLEALLLIFSTVGPEIEVLIDVSITISHSSCRPRGCAISAPNGSFENHSDDQPPSSDRGFSARKA
jgi:hypothetical protein